MAYTNILRMIRMSPTKVRPVINLIRGKSISDAFAILETSNRRAAVFIKAALKSAQANADQAEADVRKLRVVEVRVDSGPTLKRFQPKDRGRAHAIKKRTTHITVAVDVA